MRRLKGHLTYANVISTLCLFLLLGGGTAVALNGSNTVFSDDIVDNQVRSADVRNDTLSQGGLHPVDLAPNSVGSSEVKDGSLTAADLSSQPTNNVVARARGSTSVVTGTNTAPASYPLTNNSWTQAADETDFFAGRITFDVPVSPTCDDGDLYLSWRIYVNGEPPGPKNRFLLAESGVEWKPGDSNASTDFQGYGPVFEPGSPTPRTLTAKVWDNCDGESFTVTSLKVDVIGFH